VPPGRVEVPPPKTMAKAIVVIEAKIAMSKTENIIFFIYPLFLRKNVNV
jgi:hypothetical protein